MPGRARTTAEMDYFVSLEVCPKCRQPIDPASLEIYGGGDAWTLSGPCKHCDETLGFPFKTRGNPIEGPHAYGSLGNGTSEIIPPRAFAAEIERLLPLTRFEPSTLGLDEWRANNDIITRVELSVTELAKFLPDGAYAIPGAEGYTSAWISSVRDRYRTLTEAVVADKPRINKLAAEADVKRPKGIDWIEREPLQAHEQWVERGKKGKGRLVLVDAKHEGMNIGRGVELSGAQFFDVDLPDVYLVDVKLIGAELTNARFVRGRLYGAELNGAKIKGGSFKGADLKTAELVGTTLEGTDCSETELDHSEWKGATAVGVRFERAVFGEANLDKATFRGCDFRNADFSAEDPASTKARFENCDLRDSKWDGRDLSGAVFSGCKLAGISGKPAKHQRREDRERGSLAGRDPQGLGCTMIVDN